MGEVYRARDPRLESARRHQDHRERRNGHADVRERFEREAKAVARLEHPHICRVYDVGYDAGLDYLVMEHLEARRSRPD